jgi:hypothetical protein
MPSMPPPTTLQQPLQPTKKLRYIDFNCEEEPAFVLWLQKVT